jgi:hypothetical protein
MCKEHAEPETIYGPKRIWPERDAQQPVSPEVLFGKGETSEYYMLGLGSSADFRGRVPSRATLPHILLG